MDIKMKIYRLMEKREWTTYILAEKAELPQSTVATLFNSKHNPSLQTLEKICCALGITLSDLFADDELEDEGKVLAANIIHAHSLYTDGVVEESSLLNILSIEFGFNRNL